MELNYGLQAKVDQIPLMMERGYRPNGWLYALARTQSTVPVR